VELLAGLTPAARDALFAGGVVRELAPGKELYARGSRPEELAVLVRGTLRVETTDTPEGHCLFRVLGVGDIVGVSTLGGGAHTADVVAAAPSTVVLFQAKDLCRHPAVLQASLRYLGALVGTLSAELVLRRSSLRNRVRYALWRASSEGALREVFLTQEQLAERVGCSREKVSRALSALKHEGVVALGRGRIQLLDSEGLRPASLPGTA
jgi:CRP-like cAMP-binding protein